MAMPDKNKIRKETEQQYNPERNKELSLNNTDFDSQKQSVTKKYKRSIDETGDAYAPLYSEASVQKYINEKQIAENMANLGLADSGVKDLYREGIGNTYLNTEGRLNFSRQKDISSLSAELSDAVADIENQRALKKREINSRYDSLINQTAEAKYKQEAAEEEQRIAEEQRWNAWKKEEIEKITNTVRNEVQKNYIIKENGGKLSYDYKGSLSDNNVIVKYNKDGTTTYTDRNSGKKTTVSSYINPYTGTRNGDVQYGTFSNGYQPNNISGKKLIKVGTINLNEAIGRNQNVFKTPDNRCWTWDGSVNKYVRVKDVGGAWEVM